MHSAAPPPHFHISHTHMVAFPLSTHSPLPPATVEHCQQADIRSLPAACWPHHIAAVAAECKQRHVAHQPNPRSCSCLGRSCRTVALLVATACQRPATCMLSGVWVAPSCPQQHQQASDRCLASREGTTLHTCMLLGGLQTGRVCVCVCLQHIAAARLDWWHRHPAGLLCHHVVGQPAADGVP